MSTWQAHRLYWWAKNNWPLFFKNKTKPPKTNASLISLWRLQFLFLSLILFEKVLRLYFSFFHSFRLFLPHENDDYGFFLSEVVEKIRPHRQPWKQPSGDFLSPKCNLCKILKLYLGISIIRWCPWRHNILNTNLKKLHLST